MEEIKKIPEDFEHDIFGNVISFDGNTNLKKVKTQLPFTKEHVEEYMKCKNDWKYFAENYYHILSLKEGLIVPKLRDYQTEMIESYVDNRFTMVLASRQCVTNDTKIKVRNKRTGEISDITIGEMYNKLKI